ncbi:MAG: hypothetical protein U9N81_08650 [Bacillota bacterium]|nr:hypothetical protein [Bacillota bacterium]
MKENIRMFLEERDVFDVDICKDLGDNRVGTTKYLDLTIQMVENGIDIQGIGHFNFGENYFEINSVGFLSIKSKTCQNADSILVM